MSIILVEYKYGYIKQNKVYRRGFQSFPDKEIGEVRGSEQESLNFFEERFKNLESKVLGIEEKIASNTNKGSFLTKLLHIRNSLAEFAGLGDFEKLIDKINSLEINLVMLIQANQSNNLQLKLNLLKDLNNIKDHYNLKEASARVKEIKDKWIRTGSVPVENKMEIENFFKESLFYFYERVNTFNRDREAMISEYVLQYKAIIEKAKNINKYSSSQFQKQVSILRSEWKQLPRLPLVEIKSLWEEFNLALNIQTLQAGKNSNADLNIHQIFESKKRIIDRMEELAMNFPATGTEPEILLNEWKKFPRIYNKELRGIEKKGSELIPRLLELNFILKLAKKKTKNFDQLNSNQLNECFVKILKEMIIRDNKEFELIKNNAGIIHSQDKNVQKMLGKQVENKIKKLAVKTNLLNDLREQKIIIFIAKNG